MSDSLQPHGLQPARLLHPWDFQARILEWSAISFSRGSSWIRDRTLVSCTAGRLFTIWATREEWTRGKVAPNIESREGSCYEVFNTEWLREKSSKRDLSRDKGSQHLMIFLIIWNNIKILVKVYNSGGQERKLETKKTKAVQEGKPNHTISHHSHHANILLNSSF